MAVKPPLLVRVWRSGLALFLCGFGFGALYLATGFVVFFWLSLIGIAGAVVTWRREFPSWGSSQIERETFDHRWF